MTLSVEGRVTVEHAKVYPLKTFHAEGTLIFVENHQPVPFVMQRMFAVSGVTPGAVRGDHAHKVCNQALICMNGACEVVCQDGRESKTFQLTSPGMMLYVPAMIWASEKYVTSDTVLVVLADQKYDNADYIRDYDEFLRLAGITA
jgi:UDP-2-acetamido-3-amino-2,3-dideoxy-glucuronate N-acetyltransferase